MRTISRLLVVGGVITSCAPGLHGFLAVCTVCNLCRPPGTYVHVAFYIKVRGKRASGVRLASRRGVSRHFAAVRDRRDNQLRNASLSHCVATL